MNRFHLAMLAFSLANIRSRELANEALQKYEANNSEENRIKAARAERKAKSDALREGRRARKKARRAK
jgi:hypothetical protein